MYISNISICNNVYVYNMQSFCFLSAQANQYLIYHRCPNGCLLIKFILHTMVPSIASRRRSSYSGISKFIQYLSEADVFADDRTMCSMWIKCTTRIFITQFQSVKRYASTGDLFRTYRRCPLLQLSIISLRLKLHSIILLMNLVDIFLHQIR